MAAVDDPYEVRPWFAESTGEPVGRALVLPGGGYSVDHPLLFWACQVLTQAGWRVVTMRWRAGDLTEADRQAFVDAGARRLDAEAGTAARTIVLGKSLGCYAAAWASALGYPGIWLTPVLTDPVVAGMLASYRPPSLVLGGTADSMWSCPDTVRDGQRIVELDGVDHMLHRGSDWRASIEVLGTALAAVEEFASTRTV